MKISSFVKQQNMIIDFKLDAHKNSFDFAHTRQKLEVEKTIFQSETHFDGHFRDLCVNIRLINHNIHDAS